MICLAVNTANTLLTVELARDGQLLHRYESLETRDQGNLLLRHIQAALDAAKLDYADIGLLAVVTGPGSFTGIRIGLATLRAIALATGLPILGLSSFDIFAKPSQDRLNIIALESWREELYFEMRDERGAVVLSAVNETPEDFVKRLPQGKPFLITGDAAGKIGAFLPDAEIDPNNPASGHLAACALQKFKTDDHPDAPLPFYLREADVTISKKA